LWQIVGIVSKANALETNRKQSPFCWSSPRFQLGISCANIAPAGGLLHMPMESGLHLLLAVHGTACNVHVSHHTTCQRGNGQSHQQQGQCLLVSFQPHHSSSSNMVREASLHLHATAAAKS